MKKFYLAGLSILLAAFLSSCANCPIKKMICPEKQCCSSKKEQCDKSEKSACEKKCDKKDMGKTCKDERCGS